MEDIFSKIKHFAMPLFSVLFLSFASLTIPLAIQSQENTNEIRDKATFTQTFTEVKTIEPRKAVSVDNLATSRTAVTYSSYSYYFTIANPTRVSTPAVDAGYGVMRYLDKFLYGHSSLAFSPLKSLGVGSRFVVTMDGETNTYEVVVREVFERDYLDSNSALRKAIYNAKYHGANYDLSLMTCGNGSNDDSSYRLVLFANKV